jgi:antitoxin HigA-1
VPPRTASSDAYSDGWLNGNGLRRDVSGKMGEIGKIGMRPASPGEFVREEMLVELQLSVTRAAEVLGVRRATLSDLVNGHAALSPEMALRIDKAFGVDMDMLLRMKAWHDAYTMRQRANEIDVRRFVPSRAEPA